MTGELLVKLILALAMIAVIVSLVGLIFTSYMLRRNRDVYDFRVKFLTKHSVDEYETLASYDEMMRRWWVRDLNKFRKG